jgi:hypothetical protein
MARAPARQVPIEKQSDPLAARPCESCGRAARFVGLETDARDPGADLCTYECDICGHLQTEVIARKRAAPNGAHRHL